MKLKKILLAASALALVAPSANALDFNAEPGIGVPTGVAADAFIAPGIMGDVLASELILDDTVALAPAALTDAGLVFEIELTDETASFPSGQNLVITVDLPAGLTFGADVTAAAVLPGDDDDMDDTANNIAPADVTISSGGGADDSQVVFLYTTAVGDTDEAIAFHFPVEVDTCPGAMSGVSVGIETETGTIIEGGPVTSMAPGITCAPGFEVAVLSDEATDDTEVDLDTPGAGYEDIQGGATLGTYQVTLSAAAPLDGLDGAAVDAADIEGFTFDVQFADATGLATVSDEGGAEVIDQMTNSVALDGGMGVDVAAVDIDLVTAFGTADQAPIAGQMVTATNISLDLGAAFNDQTFPDVALDELQREGSTFGPFDWNNADGPVNSIYRITGLSNTEDTVFNVTYTNSNTGQDIASVPGVIAAADVTNGEYRITSRGRLNDMNMGYGTADITLFFEAPGLDVDRLISSNGVVGNFGNNAIVVETGDSEAANADD